jgi:hypothetical protein
MDSAYAGSMKRKFRSLLKVVLVERLFSRQLATTGSAIPILAC